MFGDEVKQRNIRLLVTAFVTLSIILLILNYFTGSSATGHSILEGVPLSEEKGSMDNSSAKIVTFRLDERQKFDLAVAVLKLKLLSKEENKLQYAEKISKIDQLVHDSGNEELSGGWESLTACLDKDGCTDEFYVFLKSMFAAGKSQKKSFWEKQDNTVERLLENILELKLAAEKNNIIMRSKLVTETNSLVINQGSLEAKDLWESLVNCNFKCDEFDKLLLTVAESYFER